VVEQPEKEASLEKSEAAPRQVVVKDDTPSLAQLAENREDDKDSDAGNDKIAQGAEDKS